ncbi:uncharacterized protein LOC143215567 [Lasioglossum baleicum]|uniref:uncharacterized protein LOC143215567 n=1 Tax=Lasioglossum baleicum TaxID=434251 RepID=UPI003FCCEF2E
MYKADRINNHLAVALRHYSTYAVLRLTRKALQRINCVSGRSELDPDEMFKCCCRDVESSITLLVENPYQRRGASLCPGSGSERCLYGDAVPMATPSHKTISFRYPSHH